MRKVILLFIATIMVCGFTNCKSKKTIKTLPYPETRQDASVIDNYFGTEVADPYRWLEDDNSAETAQWVKAENEVTQDYLSQIPYRETMKTRLTELWNFPKYGVPTQCGEWIFSFENDGLQNQSVLYCQKGIDGTKEVFLDPNTMSEGGTVAIGNINFSKDKKYMAYTASESGSDWVSINVIDIATKTKLADMVRWVKFSGAIWSGDGFYYSGYEEPTKGSELSGANQFQTVYYHKLGTPQTADKMVYRDTEHPLRYFHPAVSEDGKWVFVMGSEGTSGTELLYREAKSTAPFKVLFAGFKNDFEVVSCKDDKLLVYTNMNAENFKLLQIDLASKTLEQTDVLPVSDNLLLSAQMSGGQLFATYLKDASSRVYQYTENGTLVREVTLPGIGSTGGFDGDKDAKTLYYTYYSFNYPPTIFEYSIESGESKVFKQPKVNFNPEDFEVKQIFYASDDGTQVPMFIVHKKGLKLDGKNPTYLYAYGGFNNSVTPRFSPKNILLMEQGGVYCVANIRGGSEYGEQWHRGAMLDKKQNCFDDFRSAAEWLIENKYTNNKKLAIEGGSNGGLLVGACMTQNPDLYAVAFPVVGVLDMLRYHKFTVGWGWAVEYGSSDNEEQFQYIYKYSPLHNIKDGVCYPATMVLTADHDDRVVPAHSFKFGARLQAAQGCDKPILVRIDSNAGHGAGKPVSKSIDENADVLSFFFWNTDSDVKF